MDQTTIAPGDAIPLETSHPSDIQAFVDERLSAESRDLFAEVQAFSERYLIARILAITGNNQSRAAEILGITRGSLRHKIQTLGLTITGVVRRHSSSHQPSEQSTEQRSFSGTASSDFGKSV